MENARNTRYFFLDSNIGEDLIKDRWKSHRVLSYIINWTYVVLRHEQTENLMSSVDAYTAARF